MNTITKFLFSILGLVIAVMFITNITQNRFAQLETRNLVDYENESVDYLFNQLDCMALNIYREARGEPTEGKLAVAQVTMNRVNHDAFPDDVCGVVFQKNIFMSRVVCQFSWYCTGNTTLSLRNSIETNAYNESYEIAKKVIIEGFELESLKDALYFHSESVSPNWNFIQVAHIGNHIFYGSSNES